MGVLKRHAILVVLALGCAAPDDTGGPLGEHLDSMGFSGSALVVRSDAMLLRAGFDLADRELGVPNSSDLLYRIGSLTKPITASGLLHAAAAGSLCLDDSVCDHLPTCPETWVPVRVHHLLDHTSGIPDLFGALPSAPLLRTGAVIDSVVAARGPVPLNGEPGSAYSYSNFNYMLAGYVLERATGEDWETYLRAHVLGPAGASRTRYDAVWAVIPGRAHGYRRIDGVVRPIGYDDHSAYAAGGLLSTVDDLRAWQEAFRNGGVVGSEWVRQALDPNGRSYGLGWQIIRALGREMQNHTGGIDGFASHLAWYPRDELLIILLSNLEGTPVKALACDLARLVLSVDAARLGEPEWSTKGTAERCEQEPHPGR